MNNIEDLREAIIADAITKAESMEPQELVSELINLKTSLIGRMTLGELLDLRKVQIKENNTYGHQN